MDEKGASACDSGDGLPRLLTIREVAEVLRIHSRTAYRLVKDGQIAAIRVGSQWRVPETALHEYVATGWRRWKPQPSRAKARQYSLPMDDQDIKEKA
jgi:excisionase family DNA binding protein